jgi:hypothetical protein
MKNKNAVALGSMTSEKKAKTSAENAKLGGAPTRYYRELKRLALDVVAQDSGGVAQSDAIEALGRHLEYPGY